MTELPHEAHVAAIASLEGVGPARLRWLLSLGSPSQVWDRIVRDALSPRGAPPLARVDASLVSSWTRGAAQIDPGELWQRCVSLGIGVVTIGGPAYPRRLRDDLEPPVVLFHLGDPDVMVRPTVALVGTRRATGYGLRTARQLGGELTEAGVSVVSGLALGVDAAAHQGAVQVHGGPPVAVVAGGLDAPCPRRNRSLAAEVARTGVVLSEVPPGVQAAPWRFPVRNRIIAALADAVVVVESAGAGGSMHTVREAMERDLPVLSVPGPIDSRASEGTNQLISEGAQPCTGVDDVFAAIGHVVPGPVPAVAAEEGVADRRAIPTGDAAQVLDELGWRPASLEQLAARSGLGFRPLSAAILSLEIAGWVRRSGGWIERIARPD